MRRSVVGFVATVVAIAALQSTALIGVTSSAWAEDAPAEPSPIAEVDAPEVPVAEVDAAPEVEAPEEAEVQEDIDVQEDLNAQAGTTAAGSFTLYRVKLIEGKQAYANSGTVSLIPQVDGDRKGAIIAQASADNVLDVAVDYRIEMLGVPSDWGIRAGLKTGGFWGEYGTCSIEFVPAEAGTSRPEKDPFTCTASTVDNGFVTFHVELNELVESSGTLTTKGDRITLIEGDYVQGVPYSIPGAETVGKNSTTNFAMVVREGDKTIDPDQARTQFSYRIVDNGVPTNLYVAGWTLNWRGGTFSGNGHCGIYSVEPSRLQTIKLEQAVEEVSAYTCEGGGDFVHDRTSERIHWAGDYTVSRRQTNVQTDRGAQARLVQNYCGTVGHCGMSMATVTDSFQTPGIQLTDAINGPAHVEFKKAHTEGESFTNGFKIAAEAETNWLFEKLKFTLEYNFEHKTTSETTTETGYTFPVEKGETAYLEGNPHMIRADGVIVVIDNSGTYWELPGFSASFPAIDQKWNLHVVRTPILGGPTVGGEPTTGTTTPGTITPGGTTPPTGITPIDAQSTSNRLANTGVETPAGSALIALVLMGAGALVMVIRRRRGATAK